MGQCTQEEDVHDLLYVHDLLKCQPDQLVSAELVKSTDDAGQREWCLNTLGECLNMVRQTRDMLISHY